MTSMLDFHRITGFVDFPVVPIPESLRNTGDECLPYERWKCVADYTANLASIDVTSRRELIGSRKAVNTRQLPEGERTGTVGMREIRPSGDAR